MEMRYIALGVGHTMTVTLRRTPVTKSMVNARGRLMLNLPGIMYNGLSPL